MSENQHNIAPILPLLLSDYPDSTRVAQTMTQRARSKDFPDDMSAKTLMHTKKTLEKIIGSLESTSSIQCYSYSNDFSSLWTLKKLEEKTHHIIVWDGPPPSLPNSPIDTGRYLSPLDWAVAVTLKHSVSDTERPEAIISILDTGYANQNTDALKFLALFNNQSIPTLSNLRVYSVFSDANYFPGLDEFYQRLLGSKSPTVNQTPQHYAGSGSTDSDFNKEMHDLSCVFLKRIWAGHINQPSHPGDHHAISNILGPLVLAKIKSNEPAIAALSQLMDILGLLPEDELNDRLTKNASWVNFECSPWSEYLSKLKPNNNEPADLRLVLVDDHLLQQGWGEILCLAFGQTFKAPEEETAKQGFAPLSKNDEQIKLYGSVSADTLLGKLEGAEERYQLQLTDAEELFSEVLLLDLRLFPNNSSDEAAFIKLLVELARNYEVEPDNRYLTTKGVELPWEGFTKKELDAACTWADNPTQFGAEPPEYLRALTFLPRLVALTDLSLPIILFSSTGRREIIEALKPYGTIITDFDKPRFFGAINNDIATETREKFCQALKKALALAATRLRCRQLLVHQDQLFTDKYKKYEEESSPENPYRVQVFLDETGINDMTVGGLLAIFAPGRYQTLINEAYGENEKSPKNIFRREKQNIINTILTSLESCNLLLPISIKSTETSRRTQEYLPIHPSIADSLHKKLLCEIIEIVVFNVIRCFMPYKAVVNIELHFPTRTLVVTQVFTQEIRLATHSSLYNDWGLKDNGNVSNGFYSLGTDHGILLANQIFSNYKSSIFCPQIKKSRAYKLDYINNNDEYLEVDKLHFFADALLDANRTGTIKNFWDTGIHCILRKDQTQILLEAQRLLLNGLKIEAIHHVIQSSPVILSSYNDIHSSLRCTIKLALQKLDGWQFHQLSKQYNTPYSKQSPIWQQGTLTEVARNTLTVTSDSTNYQALKRYCFGFDETHAQSKKGDVVLFSLQHAGGENKLQIVNIKPAPKTNDQLPEPNA